MGGETLYRGSYAAFQELSKVPRGINVPWKIREYILEKAEKAGLEAITDLAGNILVRKAGRGGTVILQSHMDMVCERRPESVHDFDRDPLVLVEKEGWIHAKDTSLGADDGAGMAVMLALMGQEGLPNLELLFTAEEETTMSGAEGFDKDTLSGNFMINLDSDHEEEMIIGSAGGVQIVNRYIPAEELEVVDGTYCVLKIGGLIGGHSGEDIDKNRKNALKVLAERLDHYSSVTDLRILRINGGEASNSIMRSAEAEIIVKDPSCLIGRMEPLPKKEGPTEELRVGARGSGPCLSKGDSGRVVDFLNQLPYGVMDRNRELDGQVSCSTNPGIIRWENGGLNVVSELRSDDEEKLVMLEERFIKLAEQYQWKHTAQYPYPGWKPERDTVLVKKAEDAYGKIYGKQPRVKAVHAGLECGIFKEALPKLQIVSLGPTIVDYHSPDERMDLGSFERHCNVIWELLTTL